MVHWYKKALKHFMLNGKELDRPGQQKRSLLLKSLRRGTASVASNRHKQKRILRILCMYSDLQMLSLFCLLNGGGDPDPVA